MLKQKTNINATVDLKAFVNGEKRRVSESGSEVTTKKFTDEISSEQ